MVPLYPKIFLHTNLYKNLRTEDSFRLLRRFVLSRPPSDRSLCIFTL